MPRWIVRCPECEKEFTHTPIDKALGITRDVFASPPKPEIPQSGTESTCPDCNKASTLRAFDLRYRAERNREALPHTSSPSLSAWTLVY